MVNQHGLSRHIPEEIRLEVRRRCGFSCVLCGNSIVQYEHIEPEFAAARTHDPNAIALLCSSCHDMVTRGFWSKAKVWRALAAPYCKSSTFSWGEFDFGMRSLVVYVGSNLFWRCDVGIAIGPYPVFSVAPPEELGAPFRLSALFCDAQGKGIFEIRQNEWRASSGMWDVKTLGPLLTIKSTVDDSTLVLRAIAGNGLRIEQLNMTIGRIFLRVKNNSMAVGATGTPGSVYQGCQVADCPIGFQF